MCICQHGHVWHLEALVDDDWRHGSRTVDVGRRKHRGTRMCERVGQMQAIVSTQEERKFLIIVRIHPAENKHFRRFVSSSGEVRLVFTFSRQMLNTWNYYYHPTLYFHPFNSPHPSPFAFVGSPAQISLRTWLCGGQILVARGSRIDHVYRLKFPYKCDSS